MTLIPPICTPTHSRPVPDKYMKGYFSNLEVRVHNNSDGELWGIVKMYEDWLERGGYERVLPIIPGFAGMMSLTMPEADPEKLVDIAGLTAFAFIEDDLYDGDVLSSLRLSKIDPKTQETLSKKYQNAINQTKSKLFVELLEKDDAQNRYIQAYEEWVKSATELAGNTEVLEYASLEEYMDQRLDEVAASCFWNMMPILHNFNFSPSDIETLDCADQLAYRMCILTNDIYSAEKEWIAHAGTDKPGLPSSSPYIIMRLHDVSLGEAKEILKRKWLEMETLFVQTRDRLMAGCSPSSAAEYGRYLSCLQNLIAGLVVYSINCPRYIIEPRENELCPRDENKIGDLPRRLQVQFRANIENGTSSIKEVIVTNGLSHTNGRYDKIENAKIKVQEVRGDKAPWLSKYPKLSDEITLEPSDYIASMPSKGIRNVAIDALDIWYMVPQRSLEIIKNIISMLHTSSLIIDDIEDFSELRRGQPSARAVFGIPQSINSANYLFVKCLFEAQKLSPSAVAIFEDELRNLHVGQGLDLHWTFHQKCPSEGEYIQMIDGKTGGLFRMASRLMRDQATQNQELEVEDLLTLMGRFFQIRDDYQNLGSVDYARAKGTLSDLDEGKYSFMLIHALNTNQKQNHQLQSLIQTRSQKGVLSKEQKDLVMKIMGKSKSMEYTAMVLEDLRIEIEVKLEYIENQLVQRGFKEDKNWMIRAIMARLRLSDPFTRSLIK
ncbi:hypothetical protein TWF481_001849 [Arthrobotrys musiformis]|uniref:Uncharacterized protein n=1 Tax=Arthrobotrys musiformis TaxID=47236 RepID=A0AAV9VXB1_9PEZI